MPQQPVKYCKTIEVVEKANQYPPYNLSIWFFKTNLYYNFLGVVHDNTLV